MQDKDSNQLELVLSEQLIREYLSLFTRYGFNYRTAKTIQDELAGNDITFEFINDILNLTIGVTYSPAIGRKPRMFIVMITDRQGQRLRLADYLAHHKRSELIPFLTDRGRDIDMRTFWSDFFKVLDVLFTNDLRGVIRGEKWEDIPFDWQENK